MEVNLSSRQAKLNTSRTARKTIDVEHIPPEKVSTLGAAGFEEGPKEGLWQIHGNMMMKWYNIPFGANSIFYLKNIKTLTV